MKSIAKLAYAGLVALITTFSGLANSTEYYSNPIDEMIFVPVDMIIIHDPDNNNFYDPFSGRRYEGPELYQLAFPVIGIVLGAAAGGAGAAVSGQSGWQVAAATLLGGAGGFWGQLAALTTAGIGVRVLAGANAVGSGAMIGIVGREGP